MKGTIYHHCEKEGKGYYEFRITRNGVRKTKRFSYSPKGKTQEQAKKDAESQKGFANNNIAVNQGLKEQCKQKDEEIKIKEALVQSKLIEIASIKLETKRLEDVNQ